MYKGNDVCIVGRGGLFAGTWNSTELIDSVFNGETSIQDLTKTTRDEFPWNLELVVNKSDRAAEDQSYTPYGAHIHRAKLKELVAKNGGDWDRLTTLECVTLEACREAFKPVAHLKSFKKAEIILGLSTVDTEVSCEMTDKLIADLYRELGDEGLAESAFKNLRERYDEKLGGWDTRRPFLSYVLAANLAKEIKTFAGIEGSSALIDAACASSLAAMHLAVKRLQQYEADTIISGGTDISVSPGCLVFFSRLGAMSDEPNYPFDEKANGLTQGEGAGIFVLMRLEDALAHNLHVHAVIRSCEGASDGRSSAIVEPTAEGQRMAYQKAYSAAGVTKVHYIEAHGTGTKIGDRTEIESLTSQFPKEKIPIGSIKTNIGHTIAAAGAAGLLKSLGVIERRAVPPTPHFRRFPAGVKTNLFVNKDVLPLKVIDEPITIGQSCFGFGGSNFHMVVQEYCPDLPMIKQPPRETSRVVICGRRTFTFDDLDGLAAKSQYRLPPNIIPQIEPAQRLAVHAVEQTMKDLGIIPKFLDRDRVAVISSTMVPLDGYWPACTRVISSALRRLALTTTKDAGELELIQKAFAKVESQTKKITEDTLSGFLNNIVAGRVCNAFDFKGVSFNLDSELMGKSASISAANTLLSSDHGMVILLLGNESFSEDNQRVQRPGLECMIIASATYALEHDLPIEEILGRVEYAEV
jgi:3-oxoacyl-(acyl-carrier-protein) synthase